MSPGWIRLAPQPSTTDQPLLISVDFRGQAVDFSRSMKSAMRRLVIQPKTGSSPPLNGATLRSITSGARNACGCGRPEPA